MPQNKFTDSSQIYIFGTNIFSSILVWLTLQSTPALAQSNLWYKGKVVRSKGTCTWLIRITDTNDQAFLGKLIEPTGNFPEEYQHRRIRLHFEMQPLRQPVPDGCKADVVASVSILTKE